MIKFEIDEPLPLLNVWQRAHWARRSRITKGFAWLIREALGKWTKPPIERCIIYIERYSAGDPDPDAIVAKPLLDALVVNTKHNPHGMGVILDDNRSVIEDLKIVPKKCKRGAGKTIVEIKEILIDRSLEK